MIKVSVSKDNEIIKKMLVEHDQNSCSIRLFWVGGRSTCSYPEQQLVIELSLEFHSIVGVQVASNCYDKEKDSSHHLRLVFTSNGIWVVVRVIKEFKIEKWRCKQGHKLDRIRVRRIRKFPFLTIPFMTLTLMIWWKLGCRSGKQKQKNQSIPRLKIEH